MVFPDETTIELLLIATLSFCIITAILLIILLFRNPNSRLARLEGEIGSIVNVQEKTERAVREEISLNRDEANSAAKQTREELDSRLNSFSESLLSRMSEIAALQKNQLDTFSTQLSRLTLTNEDKLDVMRKTVEEKLSQLRADNSKRLEEMRLTVDEKLHSTLEKRLGESFKIVSERLELVHKGIGEMQTLASSVGDLKKIMTNVKTRGVWGEVQLENLLDQILTKDQYEKNVATKKGSNERVEFAVKLPGHSDGGEDSVWLPVDAKFPQEDFQRLVDAIENGDKVLVDESSRQLEARIKAEARAIKEKYLDPPSTTDFGILFLPVESLYSEILRRPGLCDKLQRQYRIVVTGPTTLAALLNSLQMGFRTLAIEKRSSEVWALLGAVKTEFTKFGDILDKTQKKLHEAGNTIETAARKSRTIERRLRDVQKLPLPGTNKT